jgi:hypothetical protein
LATSSSSVLFKDLRKLISQQQDSASKELFDRLHNKPFWVWDIEEHKQEDIRTNGDCCFNHIIGLPQKDGVDKPLFDYEEIIFTCLADQNGSHSYNKNLWIKKAMELFKDTHLVKLELLSNATTIDSTLNYIKSKQKEQGESQKESPIDSTTTITNHVF